MSEELLNTTVEQEYDASQIQVLEGLEAVRKRPGMYIGSTSASGLHHLVYEIVDNAIDEALAGYCTHITVTINPGDTITVTDNGRGIPVDIQAQTGRPALEVVYTVLHAGGKFGGGGYKVSGGLHGVGASVVNALSEWLTVEVHKEGKIYQMKFARGNITQEMRIIGDTDRHGTIVTFKPDPEMFDTLVYDYETLHTRMREQAFLNAGLRIEIADRRTEDGPSDSMCYEGGIREFVLWHNRHKTPLHEEVVYMAGVRRDAEAEVALQYHDGYNETIVSFANNIHTPEGGMHETGFKTALTRVLNAYGVKTGVIKTDADKVSGEDCREGLTAVISVKLTDAQFEGQTKAKLGNAYIRTLVDSIVNEQLSTYFEEHPAVARTILEKAMTANRAREAAQRAINSPLLEDVSLESAKAVLYNITASMDISTDEIAEIGDIIADATPEDTNIIFGVVYDENIGDELRLTVIATGIDPSATVVQPVAEPVKSSSVTKFPGSQAAQAARPMEAPQAPAYEQPRPRPVRQRGDWIPQNSYPQGGYGPYSAQDQFEKPTYLRTGATLGQQPMPRRQHNPGHEDFTYSEEDFEIPTFIRTQAD